MNPRPKIIIIIINGRIKKKKRQEIAEECNQIQREL